MRVTSRTLIRHELIGLTVEIANATNKALIGLSGLVVDESRNMLTIETKTGIRKIAKAGSTFMFMLPSGQRVMIEGGKLVGRPEERIRKRARA
jgi:ribonuclease P protein subunit POP4